MKPYTLANKKQHGIPKCGSRNCSLCGEGRRRFRRSKKTVRRLAKANAVTPEAV